MDQIKIGKYIAGKRKALALTQRQLAEQLGMSDKSVSKWERGVCLPDVSVYEPLCGILGISVNEFLAGEDIPREELPRRAEDNLLQVSADSKRRQRVLKRIIAGLSVVALLAAAVIAGLLWRAHRPRDWIAPLDGDSAVWQAVQLLTDHGALLYRFQTSEPFGSLTVWCTEYRAGERIGKEKYDLAFTDGEAPEAGKPIRPTGVRDAEGMIGLLPDYKAGCVRLIIAGNGTKYTADIPAFQGPELSGGFGTARVQLRKETPIRYGEEQGLAAIVISDHIYSSVLEDFEDGGGPEEDPYDLVYYFSVQFGK